MALLKIKATSLRPPFQASPHIMDLDFNIFDRDY